MSLNYVKTKSPVTKYYPRGNRAQALRFQVQHDPSYTNLTFACNAETLGSLYSPALPILTESTKSSGYEQGPGSTPTGGNILLVDFFCFHVVKTLVPILALLAFLCISKKTL